MIRSKFGRISLVAVAILIGGAARGEAETAIAVGAMLDSAVPDAVAATAGGSLEASRISGAIAYRGDAVTEIAFDQYGIREYSASLGAGFSAAKSFFVAGLSFDGEASEIEGLRSLSAGIAAPFSWNGFDASLSFVPDASFEFLDDPSATFAAEAAVSLLAADFVLKPGIAVSVETFDAGGRTVETRPSLGAVWYPGLPLSADLSVWWRRVEDEAGAVSDEYPASLSVTAVPFAWLSASLQGDALMDGSVLLSYGIAAAFEFSRESPDAWSLSFPFAFSLGWSADGNGVYSTSLSAGMRWRR
ncbi:MAG TPA: hypothetical protein DIC34_03560 [Treponema sp.]|nr:MAG: hypothetical protein A2001_18050 [Treponema sp. GWC1_61_84]HCM25618.1 hypothetical protein [Treponema sp.]